MAYSSNRILGLNGIGHVELYVNDVATCAKFYAEKLGWTITEQMESFVDFKVDGVPFSLLANAGGNASSEANPVVLLFIVEDCDEAVSLLAKRGIEFAQFPEDKPWGRVAEFCDPEGNRWQVIDKNPLRAANSAEFTNQVQRCFEAKGYTCNSLPGNSTITNFFLIKTETAFKETLVAALCLDTSKAEVTDSQINYFVEWVERSSILGIDSGLIITPTAISDDLKHYTSPKVQCRTYRDIVRGMINFDKYIKTLLHEIESDPENILDFYVDLDARLYNQLGLPDKLYTPLDNFIFEWLGNEIGNHISILGVYGTGKTSFCKHFTYQLSKEYLRLPQSTRIPILISLRDYSKSLSVEQLITDLLVNRYGLREASYQAFEIMLENGLFLLVFDGFDEMAREIDFNVTLTNFKEIAKLSRFAKSKSLLTCREEFFRTESQATEILRFHSDANTFDILILQPLDDEQIKEYLTKRLSSKSMVQPYWERIHKAYDLFSLAQHPVLLNLIIRYLPELQQGDSIHSIDLYERSIMAEVKRRTIGATLLERDDRIKLMQLLAMWMVENHQYKLHYTKIGDELDIKDYFSLGTKRDIEYHLHDFLTCSFLSRTPQGDYSFSHRSFLEYLAARQIAFEIANDVPDHFKRISLFEICQEFTALKGFLTQFELTPGTLFKWIDRSRNSNFEQVGYLGGNSITILNWLAKADLSKCDFGRTILRGADLSQANLSETNLNGVDMRDANLEGALLTGANASGADWTGTVITDMDKVRTLCWSADGMHLATAGIDGRIRVWNAKTGKVIYTLRGHQGTIWSLEYGLDDSCIFSSGGDSTIRCWDTHLHKEKYHIQQQNGSIFRLCIDSLGKRLFSGGRDGYLRVWNLYTGALLTELLVSPRHYIYHLDYSRENDQIAVGTNDSTIRIYDGRGKTCITTILVHTGNWSPAVKFNSNGKSIVGTLNKSGGIGIWDISTGDLIQTLSGHSEYVQHLEFTKNSDLLASCGEDKVARLWNVADWSPITALIGHQACVMQCRFDNNGSRLATASSDSTAKIWNCQLNDDDFCQNILTLEMRLRYDNLIITDTKGLDAIVQWEEPGFKAQTISLKDWLIKRGARL